MTESEEPAEPRHVFAEPLLDRCFIPRAADPDRSRRILERAADWYGGAFKVAPPPDPDQP